MIRKITAICLAIAMTLTGLVGDGIASTKKKQQGPSLPLIRDAEIEGLLRLYSRPIFKAAGLNPDAVRVYIINNDKINAFVAGGQRLFIHTGLLMRAKTPNEIIGVLAHETGHIAGGHGDCNRSRAEAQSRLVEQTQLTTLRRPNHRSRAKPQTRRI